MIERCANCDAVIGNLETPFVWRDAVVCETCYLKLEGRVSSQPTESRLAPNTLSADTTRLVSLNDLEEVVATAQSPRPASRPSTMGRFLRILGVVDGDTPMSCPHCGTDNPVTAQSCQSCGVPIRTAVQVKVPWRLTIISLLFCGVGCCGPVGCIGAFFCGNISIVALIFCIMASCAGDRATAQSKTGTAKMFALAGIAVGSLAFVGNLVFQILSWYAQMGRHYSG